ncbi:MAG: formyltransferase family protein, partial [Planctomycetota bacterium]
GCTVHYVTNNYDSGPIILQEVVKVEKDDTPQTLANRVFEKEKELYPKAIELVLNNNPYFSA